MDPPVWPADLSDATVHHQPTTADSPDPSGQYGDTVEYVTIRQLAAVLQIVTGQFHASSSLIMRWLIISPQQLTRLTRAVNMAVQEETFFSE
jgi:hypothetical protein